jgi:glycosyltransferase involved in cell wall biosynthesis
MKPFLSVCLIVKDEEKVLRRCLESIKGIADEIVIADTGSTDKSKEIASEYTEMIYDYKWEDDFSKARNFAGSKASGEWIMAIDADEYVDRESFTHFKKDLKNSPPDCDILAVQIVNFIGNNGKNTVLNFHERIYKNNGTIIYHRKIHEMLKHKDSNEKKGYAKLQIFHTGYMENVVKEKSKSKRNLKLLESIKEKEGYDYYFLGDVYFQLGDLEKAISNYKKAFQLKGSLKYDWVVRLLVKLISCLQAANRNKEALEIIGAADDIYINFVDFKFFKGQIYLIEGKDTEAINIFEEILLRKDQLKAHSSIDYLEYLPHKYLGELYEKENQLQLAVQHYSKSLSINDTDDYLWMRLINLLAKHSTIEELIQFLNNNCLKRKTMPPLRVIKILLSVPNINVQTLTRSFLNNSGLSVEEEQALYIKNLFLDGSNNEILELLNNKNINEISILLSKGIFDISDFILLGLITNAEKVKSNLFSLKIDQTIKNLLNLLYINKSKELSTIEEDLFISIFKQAYVNGMGEVGNKLNAIIGFLSIDGKRKLEKELATYNLDMSMY